MSGTPIIMITAAEASADAHAADLIDALRRRLGEARFVGIGGEKMASAGCELIAESVGRATMITGPFRQLSYYRRLIRQVAEAMDGHRPSVLVPVDSPALNWHMAKAARKRGVPVAYYVAPQVWAWAPWRIRKVRRLTDVVACILPFEEDYFRARGVNARYVGHPLFEGLPEPDPPDLSAPAGDGTWRIALLPGSRRSEIEAHAGALAEVVEGLRRTYPQAEFTFVALNESVAETIRRAAGRDDLTIAVGDAAGVLAQSHFAFTVSGTATLLAAHFGVPMAVVYRVNRLAWHLLGRWLVRAPFRSLANILAGREIVPELMPWFGDAGAILRAGEEMLSNLSGLQQARTDLLHVAASLRLPPPATAADNTAELVIAAMRGPKA